MVNVYATDDKIKLTSVNPIPINVLTQLITNSLFCIFKSKKKDRIAPVLHHYIDFQTILLMLEICRSN